MTATLQAGSTSPDLVAIEARKAANTQTEPVAQPTMETGQDATSPPDTPSVDAADATVISLPVRRTLPEDPRPVPSVDVYDRLLKRTPKGTA
jgi:hypothetical protein